MQIETTPEQLAVHIWVLENNEPIIRREALIVLLEQFEETNDDQPHIRDHIENRFREICNARTIAEYFPPYTEVVREAMRRGLLPQDYLP